MLIFYRITWNVYLKRVLSSFCFYPFRPFHQSHLSISNNVNQVGSLFHSWELTAVTVLVILPIEGWHFCRDSLFPLHDNGINAAQANWWPRRVMMRFKRSFCLENFDGKDALRRSPSVTEKVYEIIVEVEQHRHFSSHYAAQRLNIHHSFQLSWLEIFGCHTNWQNRLYFPLPNPIETQRHHREDKWIARNNNFYKKSSKIKRTWTGNFIVFAVRH